MTKVLSTCVGLTFKIAAGILNHSSRLPAMHYDSDQAEYVLQITVRFTRA